MGNVQNKITYLDGARLHRALVAGIRQVISRQDYLNEINVFPVPDRDTGTNMALTLNAIIEGTYTIEGSNSSSKLEIKGLLETVADSALNGARGNSGAILAQFFYGLSEGAQTTNSKLSTKNFVAAISTGANYAHKALSEPKEGTILTILRDFSDELTHHQLDQDECDFLSLMEAGIKKAERSLANTTNQLKALKKAGVVDAGAQGFVDFLNGIYEFILNGSIKDLHTNNAPSQIKAKAEDITAAIDESHRFCTECLISGSQINHDELRQELEELGNSLIVAGSKIKAKVHIHTNDPSLVFNACKKYGNLSGEKADDMIHQQRSINKRKQQVAILTDSGADLPEGIIAKLDIHVVPILIHFEKQCFIDKVSISPLEFYRELEHNPHHPTTSQPSFGDFNRQYQYLNSHYESIIAIHIPRSISGTLQASETAASKSENKNDITIIDSMNVTTAQGLVVRYAAEAAKAGLSHQQIIELTEKCIKRTRLFAALPDLSYTVRGGRVSRKKQRIIDFLRLIPVISFSSSGSIKSGGLLFGRKNMQEKLAKLIRRKLDNNKVYRFSIAHSNCKQSALKMQQLLQEYFPNIDAINIVDCGAALGVHVGPGVLGVGIQEYLPLD